MFMMVLHWEDRPASSLLAGAGTKQQGQTSLKGPRLSSAMFAYRYAVLPKITKS